MVESASTRTLSGILGARRFPDVKTCATEACLDAEVNKAGSELVVIFFTANWAYPSRELDPMYTAFAGLVAQEEDAEPVHFLRVVDEDNPAIIERYQADAFPMFIFLRDGERVATVVGANLDKVKAEIEFKPKMLNKFGTVMLTIGVLLSAARNGSGGRKRQSTAEPLNEPSAEQA
mmetsp:Transcript_50109/g.112822  ORF Transcript_50109/g.112822 Transcript_50109/m.112822 type:complete len:176 (-) Transcript_50109:23-550(-)